MSRPVVYISGPISKGDRTEHFAAFCRAHACLMRFGFAPINPGLSIVAPFAWEPEYPHKLWIDCDLPLVRRSDAVLRLPGESLGADRECEEARLYNVPVYYSIDELIQGFGATTGANPAPAADQG